MSSGGLMESVLGLEPTTAGRIRAALGGGLKAAGASAGHAMESSTEQGNAYARQRLALMQQAIRARAQGDLNGYRNAMLGLKKQELGIRQQNADTAAKRADRGSYSYIDGEETDEEGNVVQGAYRVNKYDPDDREFIPGMRSSKAVQGAEKVKQGQQKADQGDRKLDIQESQGNRRLDQGDRRLDQGDERNRQNQQKIDQGSYSYENGTNPAGESGVWITKKCYALYQLQLRVRRRPRPRPPNIRSMSPPTVLYPPNVRVRDARTRASVWELPSYW